MLSLFWKENECNKVFFSLFSCKRAGTTEMRRGLIWCDMIISFYWKEFGESNQKFTVFLVLRFHSINLSRKEKQQSTKWRRNDFYFQQKKKKTNKCYKWRLLLERTWPMYIIIPFNVIFETNVGVKVVLKYFWDFFPNFLTWFVLAFSVILYTDWKYKLEKYA